MLLPAFVMLTLALPEGLNHLGILPDPPEIHEQKIRDRSAGDGLDAEDFSFANLLPLSLRPMKAGERERDELNKVIYLTELQRENYELRERDGLLYSKDGITPFNTTRFYGKRKLLFVISKDMKIYAARGVSLKVHHSSLLAGDEVLAAGKIVSRNGKILHLTDNSGHYRPCAQHLLQALNHFHRLGVLSPEATIQVRDQGIFSLKDGVAKLTELVEAQKLNAGVIKQ